MGNNTKTKNKFLVTLISTIMILALIPAMTTPATATATETTEDFIIKEIHITLRVPLINDEFTGEIIENIEPEKYNVYPLGSWRLHLPEDFKSINEGNPFVAGKYEVKIGIESTYDYTTESGFYFGKDTYVTVYINGKHYDTIYSEIDQTALDTITFELILGEDVSVVGTNVNASVEQLKGNQNKLTITVTELLSDSSKNVIENTFMINNNAAGTYKVIDKNDSNNYYMVFVETKGNTQIRSIYIVEK